MSNNSNNSQFKSPTDIAREAFRQLAIQRIAPTPEAYQKLYNEIAGIFVQQEEAVSSKEVSETPTAPSIAENLLASFATSLINSKGDLANFGHRFNRAIRNSNWEEYSKALDELTEHMTAPSAAIPATPKGI